MNGATADGPNEHLKCRNLVKNGINYRLNNKQVNYGKLESNAEGLTLKTPKKLKLQDLQV